MHKLKTILFLIFTFNYSCLNACAIDWREDRHDGIIPPSIPIMSENIIPVTSIPGVTRNENASSVNDCQLVVLVEIMLKGSASKQPKTPPMRQIKTHSKRNENRTA